MGCPVAELQGRMSSREFAEWVAYSEIEPWGEWRADYRAASIQRTLAEINRDRKKRQQPYTAMDFMPRFGVQAEAEDAMPEQSPDVIRSKVEHLNSLFPGAFRKRAVSA